MGLFIHPEIQQVYTFEKKKVGQNKPELDYEQASTLAFVNVWNRCMEDTNKLLEDLVMRPITTCPIEDYERYLAMEDALDDLEASDALEEAVYDDEEEI